jgi:acyl carrier protein
MELSTVPQDLETWILESVAVQCGAETAPTRDVNLEALDIDSLDLIELGEVLEEERGILVEPSDLTGAITIGDLVDAVKGKQE